MPERAFTLDELTEVLELSRLERAGARTSPEIADLHLQHLLARVAALSDALRAAESSEAAQVASRILLNDLAAVADQFRGRANTMRAALARALADLCEARPEAPGAK